MLVLFASPSATLKEPSVSPSATFKDPSRTRVRELYVIQFIVTSGCLRGFRGRPLSWAASKSLAQFVTAGTRKLPLGDIWANRATSSTEKVLREYFFAGCCNPVKPPRGNPSPARTTFAFPSVFTTNLRFPREFTGKSSS